MSNKIITKDLLTTNQFNLYNANAQMIEFWRNNPVQACEDLLGIKLLDFQAYMLQKTWTSQYSLWCLTRNGSKTVTGAILLKLVSLLFENQKIFIVSSNGKQAKNMFNYVENLALNKISEFGSTKDIFYNEIARGNSALSGFSHSPESFEVSMLNGSYIKTLNGNPDGNRSFRADTIFFDECGFMQDEQITVAEAFATNNKSFKTSVEEFFDTRILNQNKPSQLIYASSASDKTTYFYKKYNEFFKRMVAGDNKYFVIDINIDVPLAPTLEGKPYPPLLDRSVYESVMSTNPAKGMREYRNKFDDDGGEDQIIKGHTIENNSTFILPEVYPQKGAKYILAYDPASTADNSVLGVAKICRDKNGEIYGEIVNMENFKDLSDKSTKNKQLLYPEQVKKLQEYIVRYNGDSPEYENIHKVCVDIGPGGGGQLYSHQLMLDFKDKTGKEHRGIIDKDYFDDDKLREFKNAYPVLRMIEPTKWKPIMNPRLIDLMDLGLIRFPVEYNNSGKVYIENEDGESVQRILSNEEQIALINIDICKEECKLIHRFKNSNGTYSYKLRPDLSYKMNDDRYYVLLMLANEIHELRDKESLGKNKKHKEKDRTVLSLFN